jgi:hypothetical protein
MGRRFLYERQRHRALHFSSLRVVMGRNGSVRLILRSKGRLAAVVATLVRRLPGDGSEGALEEGVVDDVAFVIFAFDDPIAGVGFALTRVGEDEGGVEALRGVD